MTFPAALIPRAVLKFPPSVPRSCIVPVAQRNACVVPEASRKLFPTTCPRALIANAWLTFPPSAPRSCIVPLAQRKACSSPEAFKLFPATCPRSLIAMASLTSPPSVPRSVTVIWLTTLNAGRGTAGRGGSVASRQAATPSPVSARLARRIAAEVSAFCAHLIYPPSMVAGLRTCLRQDIRWPVCTDACKCLSSRTSLALCTSPRAICYSASNSQKSARGQQVYALQAQDLRRALAHQRERSSHRGGHAAPQAGAARRACDGGRARCEPRSPARPLLVRKRR